MAWLSNLITSIQARVVNVAVIIKHRAFCHVVPQLQYWTVH
jgi:hypothetical protein